MESIREKKAGKIAAFVFMCILINYTGKYFAAHLSLPLWLDSIGTLFAAYALGPLCGALVGLTCNISYGFSDVNSIFYALTSVSIGVSVGIYVQKNMFNDFFSTVSCSVLVTVISVVISTPLNIILYDGYTGNAWGDGVIDFLLARKIPLFFACGAGEFYVDFVDKLLSIHILYVAAKRIKGVSLKNVSIVFILLLPLVLTLPVEAAEDENDYNTYVQTVYDSNNLLPCGEANDIAETGDGAIWIGTYAGLYRYNGGEMRLMDEFQSVKNVNCLYLDEEGRLWIGTNDSGVSIMINEHIGNVVDDSMGLHSNSIRSIVRSADGLYYVGTSSDLHVISINGGLSVTDYLDVSYAFSLTADKDGCVAAVGGDGALYLMNNRRITESKQYDTGDGQYTCCMFAEDGLLYVGTSDDSIEIYDISSGGLKLTRTLKTEGLGDINSIEFFNDNDMFLCADNGIAYFDTNEKYHFLNTDSFGNSVDNMIEDYQGNIWFASSRMGLLKLCKTDFTNYFNSYEIPDAVVNSMTEKNSILYVGTDNGLVIIDSKRGKVENALTDELSGVRIRCVTKDSAGVIWICTYGQGLVEYNAGKIKHYTADDGLCGNRVRVAIETDNKEIVVAAEQGVSFIKDDEIIYTITKDEGLTGTMILSLMEWKNGTILAATDGDGVSIIQNKKVVQTLTKEDGLSSGVVLRTVKDSLHGGVYFVTSNGLCYMDNERNIKVLSNFPYFNNYDIWETAEGKLFILGSAGIYVSDAERVIKDSIQESVLLDSKSGLTSAITANSWNYMDENGYLYFSCDKGVFGVSTREYGNVSHSYRMTVSKIRQNGESLEFERGEDIVLAKDTNKIEIYPEVINFSNEDPYVSYYLEGFDSQVTTVPQSQLSTITYTNIPSGEYVFHLSVNDIKTGEAMEESTYTIIKKKELYENFYFGIYMFVVMIAAVAWLTWYFVRTQIQPVIDMQKKEIEFTHKQIEMGNETILAIARTVDAKDSNTSHHSQRVSEYSVLIAKELGMSKTECENLRRMALLHDIGKIGIPDSVLNKAGKLDDEEYRLMKNHVNVGAEILKDFTLIDGVWKGALYHHEKYDGTGYAHGLKGEEIPLEARIIGIADAFDAMTANRVYRKRLPFEVVLSEIRKGSGTQFDPKMVDILLRLIDDGIINEEYIYGESEKGTDV